VLTPRFHIFPELLLFLRGNDFAASFRAETDVNQDVDVGMAHERQPSISMPKIGHFMLGSPIWRLWRDCLIGLLWGC